jgi:hypothetical protein
VSLSGDALPGPADYGVWELKFRHTASAPDRFLQDVAPALENYSKAGSHDIVKAVMEAKANRLDNVDEFLAKRYGPKMVNAIKAVHRAGRAPAHRNPMGCRGGSDGTGPVDQAPGCPCRTGAQRGFAPQQLTNCAPDDRLVVVPNL